MPARHKLLPGVAALPAAMPTTAATARRDFLRNLFWTAGAAGAGLAGLSGQAAAAAQVAAQAAGPRVGELGPLGAADANGLRLPAGCSSRVVAVSGERPAASSSYVWHSYPDGGAVFPVPDGGWIYVSNSEVPLIGGAGALRFDAAARVVGASRVLGGTTANCAGGPTPWGTWLSCEEYDLGRVWECQPQGPASAAKVRPALGVFKHEAVAVDAARRTLYLTEDDGAGRFYRFVCSDTDWPAGAARPELKSGRLQVLRLADLANNAYPPAGFDLARPRAVQWVDAMGPAVAQGLVRSLAGSAAPGTVFKGGEGLWFFGGIVYFSTKGDNRIWAYDPAAQTLEVIYDFATAGTANGVLSGVDNLTVSQWGEVLVAEDGGNMELCVIRPDRSVQVLLQLTGQEGSEITGPAFSPDGRRLYFSSQRGARSGSGRGITYEVLLPG